MKVFEIKEKFVDEVQDMKRKNIKLTRKNEELDYLILTLKAALDGGDYAERPAIPRRLNPRLRRKMLEDQQRRDREDIRRKMAAGVDFIGEDVKIYDIKEDASLFEKIYIKLSQYYDEIKPFKT